MSKSPKTHRVPNDVIYVGDDEIDARRLKSWCRRGRKMELSIGEPASLIQVGDDN